MAPLRLLATLAVLCAAAPKKEEHLPKAPPAMAAANAPFGQVFSEFESNQVIDTSLGNVEESEEGKLKDLKLANLAGAVRHMETDMVNIAERARVMSNHVHDVAGVDSFQKKHRHYKLRH